MKQLFLLLTLALAACGGSTPAPVFGPPAPPPAIAPDNAGASFVAAFTSPAMHVAGYCEEGSPVPCDVPEGTLWASFNRPGNAGIACADPTPNPCYDVVNGVLTTRGDDPGFPLTTVQTFDPAKTIHVRMRTGARCAAPGCWAGIVIYDGETDYAGEYWRDSPKPGQLEVHAYRTRVEVPVSAELWAEGSVHVFDLTWRPDGSIAYAVDGVTRFTETAASPIGPDSTILAHSPHVSIFSGAMNLSVYSLAVFEEVSP